MNKPENTYREILKIGVPSFFETLFGTFASILDSKMVSAMGVTAISAVSVTNQPKLFVYSVFFALNTVTTSLIARYHGKDDRDAANMVFDHALKLTLILALILSAMAVVLGRPVMLLFSGQPDTLDDSVSYFRIIMGGMVFHLLFMEINSVLRGFGRTKLTFADNLLFCAVNLFFNYLLIEGRWGFPALGVTGAAIATVLGYLAACIFSLAVACSKELFANIPYCLERKFRMTKESLDELLSMAKSCVIDNLTLRATLLVISGITARIGSFQMAVYSVGVYLMNIDVAFGTGLQTAAVTLIGRSYGEGNWKRLSEYRTAVIRLGAVVAVILAVLFATGGKFFYSFFNSEEAFVSAGAFSSLFIGVIALFQTMKFIFNGCLHGAGMMKETMLCSIVSFSCVNLPTVALLVLVFHVGIWGVWTGTLLAQATQALLLRRFMKKNPIFFGAAPEEPAA